jgi:hypothetical protein
MGAWGTATFDNDDASDWVSELEETEDDALLRAALDRAGANAASEDASAALAAAEVIAASKGRPSASLPDEVVAWVRDHGPSVDPGLAQTAIAALDRVAARSELRELWAESESYDEWTADVADLRARLAR